MRRLSLKSSDGHYFWRWEDFHAKCDREVSTSKTETFGLNINLNKNIQLISFSIFGKREKNKINYTLCPFNYNSVEFQISSFLLKTSSAVII